MTQLFQVGLPSTPVNTPFLPDSGGKGLALVATQTASVAQELPVGHSNQYIISNDGNFSFWYGFGGAGFRATLAYLEVPPCSIWSRTFPNDATLTHISVITRYSTTTGTINFGKGQS